MYLMYIACQLREYIKYQSTCKYLGTLPNSVTHLVNLGACSLPDYLDLHPLSALEYLSIGPQLGTYVVRGLPCQGELQACLVEVVSTACS
jgi:hypothetical protein